jgi:hypothetical protein
MRILLACEESQAVTIEMRKLGHEAISCDLLPCSGGHPEWHIQQDVTELLKQKWDMIIAFPPCTYLTVSNTYMKRGCSKYTAEQAVQLRQDAIEFFMMFANSDCDKIAIENPIGIMSSLYRKPDQVIQPYDFGHPESKATCLWLKNLPLLKPTISANWNFYRCRCGNIFEAELGKYGCCDWPAKILWNNQTKSGQNKLPPSKDRHILRAKTYPRIAKAMSEQWTVVL